MRTVDIKLPPMFFMKIHFMVCNQFKCDKPLLWLS